MNQPTAATVPDYRVSQAAINSKRQQKINRLRELKTKLIQIIVIKKWKLHRFRMLQFQKNFSLTKQTYFL